MNQQFTPIPIFNDDLPSDIQIPTETNVLTKLEFLRRFTSEERIAAKAAAATDPVLDDGLMLLNLAQDIDITDTDTVMFVNYMASVSLLAAERVTQILAPKPI